MKAPFFALSVAFVMLFQSVVAQDCGCDHTISTDQVKHEANFTYEPGDVFCIEAGTYDFFRFIEFKGTEDQPLIFKNCGGQVIVNSGTYSGFDFRGCEYIHFTGTGSDDVEYGFFIEHTPESTSGVSMNTKSTDFEIDHIEIKDVGFAGIVAKTDPKCYNWPDSWRDNFTMKNLDFHDNYIHDFSGHGEGFYVGYTGGYEFGRTVDCPDNGTNTIVGDDIEHLGHLLENVKIHHNTIISTGWDGIQVSLTTSGLEIYNNYLYNTGWADETSGHIQNEGIAVGGGCVGMVYNNVIVEGHGQGIQNLGLGPVYVFNNLVVSAGERGIYNDRKFALQEEAGAYYVINNTVVNSTEEGIYYNSGVNSLTTPHEYYNNVVVNPGVYDWYAGLGSHWSDADVNSYFGFVDLESYQAAVIENNYTTLSISEVSFMNEDDYDYRIDGNSPLINAGKDVSSILPEASSDLNGMVREGGADIGAFELGSNDKAIGVDELIFGNIVASISPNPIGRGTNPVLNLDVLENNNVTLELIGSGSKVKIKLLEDISVNVGSNQVELPVNKLDLPAGVYMILVNGDSFGGAIKIQLD